MSRTKPWIALMFAGATLVAGAFVARADDKPASEAEKAPKNKATANDAPTSSEEKLLKEKELTKDDRKFLLDETAAIEKYEKVRSLQADYRKALSRLAVIVQYDDALQAMQMEQQAMQQQANALQMQINNAGRGYGRMQRYANAQLAPLRQQQSQAKAMANQMNGQIQAAKGQGPKADDRKTVPATAERARLAYNDGVRELHELVAPLMAKYHELALDKSVTDALAQLRHRTSLNYKLGPSDQLLGASKMTHDNKKHGGVASKKKTKAKAS